MSRTHHLLELDPAVVRRARSLARKAAAPVVEIAQQPHDRLGRARDAAPGRPVRRRPRARAVGQPPRRRRPRRGRPRARRHDARSTTPCSAARRPTCTTLAQKAASGNVSFRLPAGPRGDRAPAARAPQGRRRGLRTIDRSRATRDRLIKRHGDPKTKPWIYLIVATGDIYEDIPQAQAAAREGADIIAVIRSTGQSLLDYVPGGRHPRGVSPAPTPRRRTSGSCGPRSTT